MGENKPIQTSQEEQNRVSSRLVGFLPVIAFVLIIGAFAWFWSQSQADLAEQNRLRQSQNEELGLPRDYPIDVIPLYEGIEVLETERGNTESADGDPMDKWFVHAQIDGDRKPILDYYNELLIGRGMGQTQFISVPAADGSGPCYSVSYADEVFLAEFLIEKLTSDPMTQIRMTVYKVRR